MSKENPDLFEKYPNWFTDDAEFKASWEELVEKQRQAFSRRTGETLQDTGLDTWFTVVDYKGKSPLE